jgi:hypothetical protein
VAALLADQARQLGQQLKRCVAARGLVDLDRRVALAAVSYTKQTLPTNREV